MFGYMFGPGGYDNRELFKLALGLADPWKIEKVEFSADDERLDIYINHQRGGILKCCECQSSGSVHDRHKRTWRHLNFFQYETYIHCKVPRINCPSCRKVKTASIPWSRPGSGFTILFEAFVMELAKVMAISVTGDIVNEYDTRLMRIVSHYVTKGRSCVDMSRVRNIGIDETSKKKGHDYITVFVDLDEEKVLFATPGKDNTTIKRFVVDLEKHKGDPGNIKAATIDLSPAYIKGVGEQLPNAEITHDHYHVVALVNKALDEVRREEVKNQTVLKNSRYFWLKNPQNLKKSQAKKLTSLSQMNLKTARAYRIKLALQGIYKLKSPGEAEQQLKKWYFWATHSRLPAIVKVAKTIRQHWRGILNYFKDRLTNGLVESFNGIIQTIKRRARGYRNTDNFITMVYLVKGNLNFDLPPVTRLTHSR